MNTVFWGDVNFMNRVVDRIAWPFINAFCLLVGAVVTVIVLPGRLMWGVQLWSVP